MQAQNVSGRTASDRPRMGRPSLWLALSCVLGTLGPIVCSIIEYHPKKILSAWKQQLKSFSFTRCDVDIVIAAVAVQVRPAPPRGVLHHHDYMQIIVTILCFGVGRRILSKAHTWRFARPKTSPAGVGSINQGVATQSQSLDKEAQEEEDELLRRMNYLMSSFPAHVAFRYVYAVTAAVSLLGLCYSLTRLLVAFNHTSSGGRWSLLLFPFCLQWCVCLCLRVAMSGECGGH